MTVRTRQIMQAVIDAGRMNHLMDDAEKQSTPHIIAICDPAGTKDIGRALAKHPNPQDFKRRQPDKALWTFIMPLEMWQEFRRRDGQNEDVFDPPRHRFVIVTDTEVITGRSMPMPAVAVTPTSMGTDRMELGSRGGGHYPG